MWRPLFLVTFCEIVVTAMAEEYAMQTSICDLPEVCISLILSRTSVKDVCRCSLVSKLFYDAAVSDTVWTELLPPPSQYQLILSIASVPVSFSSKFQLFRRLSGDAVPVEDNSKLIWLDRTCGKICHMMSARSLSIIWGGNDRYWNWVADDTSRFGKVAELNIVWWLEIGGRVDCKLLSPNSTYKLSFIVKFSNENFYGFNFAPVKLCIILPDGQVVESGRLLQDQDQQRARVDPEMKVSPLENAENGWFYLIAGTFWVEHDWTLDSSESTKFVQFSLKDIDCSYAKYGLIVDGVRIEPM